MTSRHNSLRLYQPTNSTPDELTEYLSLQRVCEINLGTQTAEPFYTRLGFRAIHHIVPALRHRTTKNGTELPHNLVIMSKLL
ncbi:hypothetical protein [Aeromonas salmonicida]